MSQPDSPQLTSTTLASDRSQRTRIAILLVSVLMAFVMYLHRLTLGEIIKYDSFQQALGATREDLGRVLGAFFFTYALFQIPAGWMSDRFGGRMMLTGYIFVWSLLTGLTGMVSSITALLLVRLACGVAQAGAYPTSSAIVKRWIPLSFRGLSSGMISMGGRIGGATSALLTAWLIAGTDSWRVTLLILSAIGIFTAIVYWIVVRDHPPDNTPGDMNSSVPNSSAQEKQRHDAATLAELPRILWDCCKSRSLWLAAFVQFSVNIGWVFLATWLPTYLKDVQKVDPLEGARLVMIVLACGIPAQLLGGFFSDISVRMLGLRLGRILPVTSATLVACGAYLMCTQLETTFAIVACCCVVSAMTDLANPSFWAFTQDVGGKNTATVLGWCNMWGNFGASLSAATFPYLMKLGEDRGWGTTPMFVVFAGAFFCCSLAALGMNAAKPIQFATRN